MPSVGCSMGLRRGATAVPAGLLAAIIFSAGCVASEGFRCGEPPPGGSRGRACASPEEVCICASRSCATRDFQRGDAGACESGYRYLSGPFARHELRGDCVDPRDLAWIVPHGHEPYLCAATIDGGPVDAASSDAGNGSEHAAADDAAADDAAVDGGQG